MDGGHEDVGDIDNAISIQVILRIVDVVIHKDGVGDDEGDVCQVDDAVLVEIKGCTIDGCQQ